MIVTDNGKNRLMNLTLNEMLNKAIDCRRDGKREEAKELYKEILDLNSRDPDANHNMGLIYRYEEKDAEALTYFWTAFEVNPDEWQYWISYINTLILANQMNNAQIMYDAARKAGAVGEAFDEVENILVKPLERKAS